jgi:hypothetical protein
MRFCSQLISQLRSRQANARRQRCAARLPQPIGYTAGRVFELESVRRKLFCDSGVQLLHFFSWAQRRRSCRTRLRTMAHPQATVAKEIVSKLPSNLIRFPCSNSIRGKKRLSEFHGFLGGQFETTRQISPCWERLLTKPENDKSCVDKLQDRVWSLNKI